MSILGSLFLKLFDNDDEKLNTNFKVNVTPDPGRMPMQLYTNGIFLRGGCLWPLGVANNLIIKKNSHAYQAVYSLKTSEYLSFCIYYPQRVGG